MLYTRLVGEGGMHTLKNNDNHNNMEKKRSSLTTSIEGRGLVQSSTHGFNYEQVEEAHANLNVWDVGGS